ncbi:MAG: hypothetical protein MJY56_06675 [Bacteroidales bacterium]|nr:hypothetical protein [Bacteroidales bacterium]
MAKNGKKYLVWMIAAAVAIVAAVVCIYVFLPQRQPYGLFLILLAIIAFLVWKAFIKNSRDQLKASEAKGDELREEIETLKKTVRDLDRELTEKNRSRLNIVGLNPILHISVLDIDTSFVRTYVREEGRLTFNGALRTDLQVEYGIRLEDVRFKYDEMANTLALANFHPGIISYSKKQMNWEIAKSFKSRRFLGLGFSDVSTQEAELYTKRMCETLRADLEKEIDSRKVSEFDWLSPLITNHVVDILKIMVGRSSLNVLIEDNPGEGFVDFQTFRALMSVPPRLTDVSED